MPTKTTVRPAVQPSQNIYVRGVWMQDEARVCVVRRTNSKNAKKKRVSLVNDGVCHSLEEFEALCALGQLASSHPDTVTNLHITRRSSLLLLKAILRGADRPQSTEPRVRETLELAAARARQLARYFHLHEQNICGSWDQNTEEKLRNADPSDCALLTSWLDSILAQQFGREKIITDRACVCGKTVFSQEEAQTTLTDARIKRVLHGDQKRREARTYSCDKAPGIWHVTSLKGSS
ncbi:hypothetical protein ACFYN0_26885 [Streptomyces sp. NPDC006704]|uniref:hypothetical protein n=1 Tax=Streptomyces sp. NPDC006704 TaxID=3364760 RepID=UPI003686FC33